MRRASGHVKPGHAGLAAAFLAGFLLVGIPYWRIPYNKATFGSVVGGAVLIGIVALVARVVVQGRFAVLVFVVAAAVPFAVFARVVADGMRDPTSHNLWPFEIAIAWVVGFAGAAPGALVGSGLRRLLGVRSTPRI